MTETTNLNVSDRQSQSFIEENDNYGEDGQLREPEWGSPVGPSQEPAESDDEMAELNLLSNVMM